MTSLGQRGRSTAANLRSPWATQVVPSQPGLQSKCLKKGRAKGKSRKQTGQTEGVGPEPLTMQISAEQLSLALKTGFQIS